MEKRYHMFDAHTDTIHFLKRLNADLKEVITMAESDFVKINTVLRNLYERHLHQQAGSINVNLDTMMAGLQYMDVLNQRIDHLIVTHEKVATSLEFRKSFFHLHVF